MLAAQGGFSASLQPQVSPLPTHGMQTQDGKEAGGFNQQGRAPEHKVLAEKCEALGVTALSHLGHVRIDSDPSL